MENILPKYRRPISGVKDPKVDVSFWEEATDAFDEKDFKKSVIAVINYINPNLLKGKNTSEPIEIIQNQGSAEIQVSITDTTFSVKAPFLKITDKTNKVALLRRVAEVNFTPLNLAQIVLMENELWFQYEMPIAVCQPNKIYDILREVCVYADDLDDEFIENYQASFYTEPQKIELSNEDRDQIWIQISDILEDYKNYSQFFKEKRWDDFEWDIIVISLLKLSNMPYVNGKLRTDLAEYINNLFNGNIDFKFRVDKGVNFMKKLSSKSREEIMSNVYNSEQFISLRYRSSEQIIKDWTKARLEMVDDYVNRKSNFNLSYYLQFNFLKLIYDYNIEENYSNAINNLLEEVSGLSPTEAAPKLSKLFYDMHKGNVNGTVTKKKSKGFFSKLFG
ncbi:MAG: hypothetical protein ACPG4Y_09410 [Chitinophagales bacterium]